MLPEDHSEFSIDVPDSMDEIMAALGHGAGGPAIEDLRINELGLRKAEPDPEQIDNFKILGRIGEGGMGVVFRAQDVVLERQVALKLINTSRTSDDSAREKLLKRLAREAKAMAMINHPNVVAVYQFGKYRDGFYLIMDLIEGPNLETWLSERARPWPAVLELFLQAGRGLAAAHERDIVHRDFKPMNVLINADGAKVTDFGLASQSGRGESEAPQPNPDGEVHSEGKLESILTTRLIGTPDYMAPEQRMRSRVDHRADQFSFCKAIVKALGRGLVRTQAGLSQQELLHSLAQRHPAPVELWPILERGLSEDPGERWPNMVALLEALEAILRPPALTATASPSSTSKGRATLVGFVVVLALGVIAFAVWRAESNRATGLTCEAGELDCSCLANECAGELECVDGRCLQVIGEPAPHDASVAALRETHPIHPPPPAPAGWSLAPTTTRPDGVYHYTSGYEHVLVFDMRDVELRTLTGAVSRTPEGHDHQRIEKHSYSDFESQAVEAQPPDWEFKALLGGTFATETDQPTPVAFGLKRDGELISFGYASPGEHQPEMTGKVKVFAFENATNRAWVGDYGVKVFAKWPDVMGAVHVEGDLYSDEPLGRNFVGVSDPDDDGEFERVMFFVSEASTQAHAAEVLGQFGAEEQAMLCGAEVPYLSLDGEVLVDSGILIPSAIAVYVIPRG